MDTDMVCILLLLLSQACKGAMVRRLGCMVLLGSERAAVEEQIIGRLPDTARDSQVQRGTFQTLVGDSSNMTVQMCVERCWLKRYVYAALQDSSKCFCANSRQTLAPVDVWLCSERCSGNCKQRCGGHTALSVYNTGYEKEPVLPEANLARGLLGCYAAESWKEWCGAPQALVRMDTQHLTQQRQAAPLLPDDVIMASHKPPLLSNRMSALMCATYCISGPRSQAIAVVQAQDKCCCGQLPQKKSPVSTVLFSQHCKDPCADWASSPACVGNVGGQRYISVYNTWDIWPIPEHRPTQFPLKIGWHQPIFPANDKFELPMTKLKWKPFDQEELSGMQVFLPDQQPPPPISDPANLGPWVLVVDVPEEETRSDGVMWMLFIIPFLCLLLSIAIIVHLIRKNKKTATVTSDDTPRTGMNRSPRAEHEIIQLHDDHGQEDVTTTAEE